MAIINKEYSLRRNLVHIMKASSKNLGEYLSNHLPQDLTKAEYFLLGFVCLNEGLGSSEIAAEMDLSKSTVSETLKALNEKGFLRIESSKEDKRKAFIYPSEKARKRHEEAMACFRAIDEQFEQEITPEEKAAFYRVLSKIEKNIEEEE